MTNLPDVFGMPESKDELVHWLEQKLCSDSFAETVEALSIVQDNRGIQLSELSINQDRLDSALENGLSCLDRTELNQLLENPVNLYQLQEAIFAKGGEYWIQKFDKSVAQDSDLLDRIQQSLAVENREHDYVVPRQGDTNGPAPNHSMSRGWISVVGALAASVLIFLGGAWFGKQQAGSDAAIARNDNGTATIEETPQTRRATWGWNRKDALEIKLDRVNKLNHIANLLSEWNSIESKDSSELLVKAQELRQSCDVLLAAKFSNLPEDDIQWLKDKCRKWSAKIDEYIVSLSDSENFETVNADLNRLIHKSIFLIRARANKV